VNLVDIPERHYSFEEARQLVLAGPLAMIM